VRLPLLLLPGKLRSLGHRLIPRLIPRLLLPLPPAPPPLLPNLINIGL
jgi:hypothetical protein